MNCPRCEVHIDEHEASRCLRAWVARDVMEWEVVNGKDGLPAHIITDKGEHMYLQPDLGPQWYPDFDIGAAWEVVEKMGDLFANIAWNKTKPEFDDYWSAAFWKPDQRSRWIGNAATAPLAICRAAIKATLND